VTSGKEEATFDFCPVTNSRPGRRTSRFLVIDAELLKKSAFYLRLKGFFFIFAALDQKAFSGAPMDFSDPRP
jgi:hypothetical protein